MAYCNESHMDAIFNELNLDQAQDADADGTATAGLATLIIDNASHEVWSYAKPHYGGLDPENVTDVTDKTQVPVMIRNVTATLAAHDLLARMGGVPRALMERVEVLRRPETGWLALLAQGQVTVDAATSRIPDSTTRDVRRTTRPKGPFQHYGETDPGTADANDNDYYRVNPAEND